MSGETRSPTAYSRVIVAAFVVVVGPLPVAARVAPPDPTTLIRFVGVASVAVTPVAYLVLFPSVGLDIEKGERSRTTE